MQQAVDIAHGRIQNLTNPKSRSLPVPPGAVLIKAYKNTWSTIIYGPTITGPFTPYLIWIAQVFDAGTPNPPNPPLPYMLYQAFTWPPSTPTPGPGPFPPPPVFQYFSFNEPNTWVIS